MPEWTGHAEEPDTSREAVTVLGYFHWIEPDQINPQALAAAETVNDRLLDGSRDEFEEEHARIASLCSPTELQSWSLVTQAMIQKAAARENIEAEGRAWEWGHTSHAQVFAERAQRYQRAARESSRTPLVAVWTGADDRRPIRSSQTARRSHRSKAPPSGDSDDSSGDPDPEALRRGVERHLIVRLISRFMGRVR
jgi:hypothetical protein